MGLEFNVADQSLNGLVRGARGRVVRARAALRLVHRGVLAATRIRERPASSPVALDPSTQPVRALLLRGLGDRARAPDLAHVLDSAGLVRADLALDRADLRRPAKHHAHSVLPAHRAAADASSIPRPKKAR